LAHLGSWFVNLFVFFACIVASVLPGAHPTALISKVVPKQPRELSILMVIYNKAHYLN
jgi:hypothetical protein